MGDELDDLLGIDDEDPVQVLANQLVDSDYRLMKQLVAHRMKQELTQAEVGQRLGVSQPAIAAIERADADPRLSTVRRYALAVHALVQHTVGDGMDNSHPFASWQTNSEESWVAETAAPHLHVHARSTWLGTADEDQPATR